TCSPPRSSVPPSRHQPAPLSTPSPPSSPLPPSSPSPPTPVTPADVPAPGALCSVAPSVPPVPSSQARSVGTGGALVSRAADYDDSVPPRMRLTQLSRLSGGSRRRARAGGGQRSRRGSGRGRR